MAIDALPAPAEDEAMARDMRTESLLNDWGIPFELDEEYPLRRLDIGEAHQVRETTHRAPREMVEEFSLQMRAGAIFPPVVATDKGKLIDGNTRLAAAKANGRDTFPVYLVRLPRQDFGSMIGAALNQMGGKRLTAEETFAAAQPMLKQGFTDEQIARILGRSRSSIFNYRREHDYAEAAERTGVAAIDVRKTVARHLGAIKLDKPFKAAVEVAYNAGLSSSEAEELVDKVAAARSEDEAVKVVESFGQAHAAAGPPPRARSLTSLATRSKPVLRTLLEMPGTPEELAPAAQRIELEPLWQKVQERATAVLAAFAEGPVEEKPAS
jgi:ParB-like chromosome segregation protein Spo0J